MNIDNRVDLLAQAQTAGDVGNWSLLLHCLQQLVPGDKGKVTSQTTEVIAPLLERLLLSDLLPYPCHLVLTVYNS